MDASFITDFNIFFNRCTTLSSVFTIRHILNQGDKTPLTKKGCPGYDTELYMLVRLQFWRFDISNVAVHCHYSQFHSDPEQ